MQGFLRLCIILHTKEMVIMHYASVLERHATLHRRPVARWKGVSPYGRMGGRQKKRASTGATPC